MGAPSTNAPTRSSCSGIGASLFVRVRGSRHRAGPLRARRESRAPAMLTHGVGDPDVLRLAAGSLAGTRSAVRRRGRGERTGRDLAWRLPLRFVDAQLRRDLSDRHRSTMSPAGMGVFTRAEFGCSSTLRYRPCLDGARALGGKRPARERCCRRSVFQSVRGAFLDHRLIARAAARMRFLRPRGRDRKGG